MVYVLFLMLRVVTSRFARFLKVALCSLLVRLLLFMFLFFQAFEEEVRFLVRDANLKLFSCPFSDVKCSFVKAQGAIPYGRCERCGEYQKFMSQMAEEDERIMDEIDEERRGLGDREELT